MQSILLIANGQTASNAAEPILRDELVVITRTVQADEAFALLANNSFDAVVCAVDDLQGPARRCLDAIESGKRLPTVIVTASRELPLRSFDIGTRIVSIDDGANEIAKAIRQQLRRVNQRTPPTIDDTEMEFSFRFKADPKRIGKARAVAGGFIQRCLQIDERELTRLELVLEEALTNAVYHGSLDISSEIKTEHPEEFKRLLAERLNTPPYADRQVKVLLSIDHTGLSIVVSDEGNGFDVAHTAAAEDHDAVHRASGRGLLLMRAFADSVVFNETGNSVTLTKRRALAPSTTTPPLSETVDGNLKHG